MLSIGARMLQLHFGARDDGPGDPWFWIIGSGELDFKSLINLSDVNNDYNLAINKSIDEDNRKIWFKESVAPMEVNMMELYMHYTDDNPFHYNKYFKTKIDVDYYKPSFLKFITGIHTLYIDQGITEFTYNLNIHTLILSRVNMTKDISPLYGTYNLSLKSLYNVTDVSTLGYVHTLTLDYLPGVTDVSGLRSVHTLSLLELDGVTDVSALYNVHNLTLGYLHNLKDVSALDGVHTLTLDYLEGLTDVSNLGNVHILTLEDLQRVTNVNGLGTVHTLTLIDLPGVTNVNGLGPVHTLTLKNPRMLRLHLRSC
jgi:hypothetical protein